VIDPVSTRTETMRRGLRGASALVVGLLLAACGVDETGFNPPADTLWFPLGVAAHPDGRFIYLNNSVFDRRFNAGSVMVYDTEERRILPEATVEIGLFAGELLLGRTRDADCTGDDCLGPLTAYTVTRDDNVLVRIGVDADAGDAAGHLTCGQQKGACAGDAVFENFGVAGPISEDPYGIAIDRDGLWVTHAGRGVLSRWDVRSDGALEFRCALNLPAGATTVARHPTSGLAYVSDRFGQRIHVVERTAPFGEAVAGVAGDPCSLQVVDTITVDPIADRGRTRGLTFSADGSLLYAASSTDQTLRIYDTTIGTGGPRNRLLGIVPLGGFPNLVRVAGLRADEVRVDDGIDRGAVGAAVDMPGMGDGLVYVTLFDAGLVVVVDPELMLIVARIPVGDGPHDITFLPDLTGALRGYVSLFNEHRIAVLDLDSASDVRFSLIATVP
jgi:DNA-binding beta-propeller fold protein YncE